MNALELADKQAFEQGELSMWIRNETATMLRQQQAEIDKWKEINDRQTRSIKNKQAEIEALKEALMEGGVVCARCGAIAYDPVITYPAKPTKVKFASNSCESGWIYLDYEEPAKTLTDEEILKQIRHAISFYFDDAYSYSNELYSRIEAILRKAQERC